MQGFFLEKIEKNSLILAALAFMSAIIVLASSLSVISALVAFIFGLAIIFFEKSFSRGWLFVLSILLFFPQTKVGDGTILLNDIILFALALIGLIKLSISRDYKISGGGLGKYLLMLFGLGLLLMLIKYFVFGGAVGGRAVLVSLTILLLLIILETFKYYFQTTKRLERFFKLVFVIATIHSFFGIIMMIGGWQTSSGMGISSVMNQSIVFENVKRQINGFFGVGLFERTRSNVLTPFLLLSIPLGIGFLKKTCYKQKISEGEEIKKRKRNAGTFFQQILALMKKLTTTQIFILVAIAIQVAALILTFSYLSIIFLFFAFLVLAILDRNREFAIFSALGLIALSVVIPSLKPQVGIYSIDISENLSNFISYSSSWLFGSGFKSALSANNNVAPISNSYLYVWSIYGIIGLIVVLSMLHRYLKDLMDGYKKSDGIRRIWFMSLISAVLAYIADAMTGNILFFGPSALVFWLFYGAAINLKKKDIVFGITESKIIQ